MCYYIEMNGDVLEAARTLVSEQNAKAGRARWKGISKKKRSEHMRALIEKRHRDAKKKKKIT